MKVLFILTFICISFVQVFAQNINNWNALTTVNKEECQFLKSKANYFIKRQVLDSALLYLTEINNRLLRLDNYTGFLDNLWLIGSYSQKTFQYKNGLRILIEGLRKYDSFKSSLSDSIKTKINKKIVYLYEKLSSLHHDINAPSGSVYYALKSLNLRKETEGFQDKAIAHSYNNLGTAYELNKEFGKALSCHQIALKMYESLGQEWQHFKGYSYTNLGQVYGKLGNYDLALKYLKNALEITLKAPGNNLSSVAAGYQNIAKLYTQINFNDLALESYIKSLGLRIRKVGSKHPYVAKIYNELGNLHQKQNEVSQAIKYYQKALVSNITNFHDTINVYALPENFTNIYNNKILLETLKSKASLLIHLKPQKTNLEQAHKTYELADQIVDNMRKNLMHKSDELLLTSTVASMYEKALQVCWQLSKYKKEDEVNISDEGKTQVPNENPFTKRYNPYWVKAFYFAEKGKSSVLRKLATDASAKIQSNIPETVLEQERRLNGAILYYQRRLDRFQLKKQLTRRDSVQKQRFEDQRFELRRKYDQLLRDLEEKYPDYYDLKHSSYIASVADVQRRLDAKTALIEYVITDKQLFSFVITREDFQVYEQTIDRAKLTKEITRWLNNIQGGSDDAYLPRGHRFFKQFIQPLQAHLQDKKHLLIIPDALLSRLPFEAIITQKDVPVGKPESYPYLIRKWGVTLYPSASLALMQHQRRGGKYTQDFLGLAPVFEKKPAEKGAFRTELNALPFTKKEVETIHQMFQKQQQTSKVVVGEQVTEQMVKALKGRYKFVHFATHGFLEDKTPALAFYPDQAMDSLQPQNNDGALSLEEIFNLKFKADMVVLSSCQGGAGKSVRGEGILAITRGFVYLGTPHIIYTLWSVNDKDAAELMIRFYNNMSQGKSYREALRLAKLSMLESAQTAWPKWWAGFTMMSKLK